MVCHLPHRSLTSIDGWNAHVTWSCYSRDFYYHAFFGKSVGRAGSAMEKLASYQISPKSAMLHIRGVYTMFLSDDTVFCL